MFNIYSESPKFTMSPYFSVWVRARVCVRVCVQFVCTLLVGNFILNEFKELNY